MNVYSWQEAPSDAQFAVIGDPIDHSLSPQMHNAAFAALNLPYRYVAIQVPTGEVKAALSKLAESNYRGVNVTVPHKEEAIGWCMHVDGFVQEVRSVNTIDLRRHSGINTDADGFLESLIGRVGADSRSALMIGAGGSARALARALVRDGWELRIQNRTPEKAAELASAVGAKAVTEVDPTGADLIVNTTSAWLQGDSLAVPWEKAKPGALAYDLAYGAEPTPFLKEAAAHNLSTIDGLPMLIEQGALALEWWLGVSAPRDAMRAAIDGR